MLTADQFDSLVIPIAELYTEYETSVIEDIARRLKALKLDSAAWQTQRLIEAGGLFKDVIKKISKLTGKSQKEVERTLTKAGVQAIRFDDQIYKAAGLNPLPLNMSPAMVNVLKAMLEKTNGVLNNLTKTTAMTGQQSFIRAADIAHQQVVTGVMSYDQAIRQAVKNVAAQGLTTIDYPTGHQDSLDVATRRTVLTGVAQTTNQLQITRANEMGSDLVAVSAHAGARNTGVGPANHAGWQGKIYSRSGSSKRYPPFTERTGYGTGEGLGGWNCRHSFYPFFEGVSEDFYNRANVRNLNKQKVMYQGQSIDQYTATQYQREIERKIRYWKRQVVALNVAKLDSSKEQMKVSQWQATMRDFIAQTELDRQYVREQVL